MSFYATSGHTATILFLCSGRRIHDLTRLNISPDHYKIFENSVVLLPTYGSKTDTANRRQSGWKLLRNKDNRDLDPVFWITELIRLSQKRRETANSDSLFINTNGKPKPANRAIIAGWVKNILKDANIDATPGSCRSAVASKNWIENFHLDDILARGNWQILSRSFIAGK